MSFNLVESFPFASRNISFSLQLHEWIQQGRVLDYTRLGRLASGKTLASRDNSMKSGVYPMAKIALS